MWHIFKRICYLPCFFDQRQYLYYTDYIRKLQLNLALIFVSSCFHIFGFTAPAVCFACATCVTSAINSSIMIPPVVSISTSVNLPARRARTAGEIHLCRHIGRSRLSESKIFFCHARTKMSKSQAMLEWHTHSCGHIF